MNNYQDLSLIICRLTNFLGLKTITLTQLNVIAGYKSLRRRKQNVEKPETYLEIKGVWSTRPQSEHAILCMMWHIISHYKAAYLDRFVGGGEADQEAYR